MLYPRFGKGLVVTRRSCKCHFDSFKRVSDAGSSRLAASEPVSERACGLGGEVLGRRAPGCRYGIKTIWCLAGIRGFTSVGVWRYLTPTWSPRDATLKTWLSLKPTDDLRKQSRSRPS